MDIIGVVPALMEEIEDTDSGHLCLLFILFYSALPALLAFLLASQDSSFLSVASQLEVNGAL